MKKMNYKINAAYIFLAPAMTALLLFFAVPVLSAFVMSFTDFDIYSLNNIKWARFVGFRNYVQLLHNPTFWLALKNTFYFAMLGGPLSIIVSLGAALLLNSRLVRFKPLFRLVWFIPVVTSLVAVAVVWRFVYHPRFGLMNYFLGWFGINPIDWLGNPHWAMPALILMAVWKNFGYNMIIFIAGLQNIPGELYEASHIDGSNGWQQFWYITLPMLAPTTLFITIMTAVGYLQFFAEPYVMTQGGPLNQTLSVVLLMYQEGFRWWRMGYSASIAFFLFLIIFIITLIQLKLQKRNTLA